MAIPRPPSPPEPAFAYSPGHNRTAVSVHLPPRGRQLPQGRLTVVHAVTEFLAVEPLEDLGRVADDLGRLVASGRSESRHGEEGQRARRMPSSCMCS